MNKTPQQDRLMRLPEVLHTVGLKKSAWYDGIQKGRFPKPRKLGARVNVWAESEIQAVVSRILAQ